MLKFKILFIFTFISIAFIFSCNQTGSGLKTPVQKEETAVPRIRKSNITIVSPKNNGKYVLGSEVILNIKVKNAEDIDSINWFIDGRYFCRSLIEEQVKWNTSKQNAGTHRIEAIAYYESDQREIVRTRILLLPGNAPAMFSYKVIKTYPHDKKAYTQGLLFDNGYLYESTGLKGESTLRKVNIETGEPIQALAIQADFFGEGLAAVDNRLIQLTWQDQVALIYQKDNFKLINQISYPMREGWGLTYDGNYLIMSDGSATLYFLDPTNLNEAKRLEVFDKKGSVTLLNELEYINGEVWANIYRSDQIARINPETGVITGYIDMKGLLNKRDYHDAIDVLNGIAFDPKSGKIYVTGKNWPKLFEVEIIPHK